jgi:hypothetical protein
MSAEEVANAFVNHYYNTFDSNPDQLMGLFVRYPALTLSVYLHVAQTSDTFFFLFFAAHLSLALHSIITYILKQNSPMTDYLIFSS